MLSVSMVASVLIFCMEIVTTVLPIKLLRYSPDIILCALVEMKTIMGGDRGGMQRRESPSVLNIVYCQHY